MSTRDDKYNQSRKGRDRTDRYRTSAKGRNAQRNRMQRRRWIEENKRCESCSGTRKHSTACLRQQEREYRQRQKETDAA